MYSQRVLPILWFLLFFKIFETSLFASPTLTLFFIRKTFFSFMRKRDASKNRIALISHSDYRFSCMPTILPPFPSYGTGSLLRLVILLRESHFLSPVLETMLWLLAPFSTVSSKSLFLLTYFHK